MTKKDRDVFGNSSKCWICKKVYEKDKVEVKDLDHIAGKYQCNDLHIKVFFTKAIGIALKSFERFI